MAARGVRGACCVRMEDGYHPRNRASGEEDAMKNERRGFMGGPRDVGRTTGEPDAGVARGTRRWCLAAALLAAAFTLAGALVSADDDVTIAALRVAHTRELSAGLHYRAFALRAEQEGQMVAATAFRAAALGESVHAARHARQIEERGAVPAPAAPESLRVDGTADNLRSAIEMEAHETACIYPALEARSRPECQYEALASLRYARCAEATHLEVFTEVLLELEQPPIPGELALVSSEGRASERRAQTRFYVCLGDGCVFTHERKRSCPNCGSGKASFIVLSAPEASL